MLRILQVHSLALLRFGLVFVSRELWGLRYFAAARGRDSPIDDLIDIVADKPDAAIQVGHVDATLVITSSRLGPTALPCLLVWLAGRITRIDAMMSRVVLGRVWSKVMHVHDRGSVVQRAAGVFARHANDFANGCCFACTVSALP